MITEKSYGAIVYTSNTGHTAEYAKILGTKTGLPVYTLNEAAKQLQKGTEIIYLGWLFANRIKGYKKATKTYRISAVCGIGLCDTGTAIPAIRQANAVPDETPLFTMQGGMDKPKLRGIHKLMIHMLTKGLSSQKERTADEERMLALLTHDQNYVSEENVTDFMNWFNKQAMVE